MMPAGARMPFGNRHYHPIYKACERHGLPVSCHFGAEGAGTSSPPTAAGYPTYYLEMRMARPQIAMAHVTSLICEGVFEKFPEFMFLFVEVDTFWLPGLLWHMDMETYLRWCRADEVFVFASDYPHWDWDEPSSLLKGFDDDLRAKIFGTNARKMYGI